MIVRSLALLLLVVGSCGLARAQTDRDEARAHNDLAKIKFQKADYAAAREEFQKAYALAPIPELLYNIARCHEELGDRRAAAAAFRQYLAAHPDAPERIDLEVRIRELERTPPERPVAPAPAVAEPAAAPVVATAPPASPLYRRWWVWTVAALVLVGAGVAIAVVAANPSSPALTFPPAVLQ